MTVPSGRPTEASGSEHLSDAEVAGYLDHELTEDERRRVETHVDACTSCRQELIAVSRISQVEPAPVVRRARDRRLWWIPAAAAGLVAAVLLPRLTNRPAPTDTAQRTHTVTDADGRPRIAIVAPSTDTSNTTRRVFTWRSANADAYRFALLAENGELLWNVETRDTSIALPDSVSLLAGHRYFWSVDAIGTGIAASSGTQRLQIPAK